MEFLTESHEAKLGRRLVIHEFPGADDPLVEDLGAKAATVSLTAYFIGADYDLERNKMLLLLNKKGSAWLDHPWLGYIAVWAKEWSTSESIEKGGFCTISIEFVPTGMAATNPTIDHVDHATEKMTALSDTAQLAFVLSIMSLDVVASFISLCTSKFDTLQNTVSIAALPLASLQNTLSITTLPQQASLQIIPLIQAVKNDFVSLLASPDRYVSALRLLVDSVLSVDSYLSDTDRVRVVSYLTSLAIRYPVHSSLLSDAAPTSALELPANIEKDTALQACFLISVAGQLALNDYQTAADRDAVLSSVLTAIDTLLPVLPDAVFQAAVTARVAIYDALMVQDLQPTQQRTVFSAMPSTVLAYRFELDDPLFIAINAVRHPLFVAGDIYG
jgi:prophage DNA circulation protein